MHDFTFLLIYQIGKIQFKTTYMHNKLVQMNFYKHFALLKNKFPKIPKTSKWCYPLIKLVLLQAEKVSLLNYQIEKSQNSKPTSPHLVTQIIFSLINIISQWHRF